MEFNIKKFLARRTLPFLLILSFVFSVLYQPAFAPKTQAFGFSFTIDVKALAERIADGAAMFLAQTLVDRMVKSTVDWAQSGFEGNPAYVTDPQQYFTDIGDGVVGEYIMSSTTLGFLCSPFQAQIRVALLKSYTEPRPFQCTLTGVIQNVEAFYGDFSQGGWDGWFSMTQNEANNPYGAYLTAKIEMDSRMANAVGLENKNLDWNQGFRSWAECIEKNPPMWTTNNDGSRTLNPKHVPGKAVGECIQRGPTKTPGATIKSQLDRVLPSTLEKYVNLEHVEQLVNAFATGLLNRYVFGPKGLFNKEKVPDGGTPPTPRTELDIDGDGIIDAIDLNGDGQPDICIFGGLAEGSSGPPCKGSRAADGGGGDGGGGQGIDIDGDGIADGFDSDRDGKIDNCYFGGNPPDNCKGSRENGGGGEATSLIEDLRAERAKYPQTDLRTLCPNGTSLQPETCPLGAMLNAVAWKNRDKGWGLSGKTGGHRCPSPAGVIACDILQFKSTMIMYDVFGRGGEETTPRWAVADPPNPPDPSKRPWVAPVAP